MSLKNIFHKVFRSRLPLLLVPILVVLGALLYPKLIANAVGQPSVVQPSPTKQAQLPPEKQAIEDLYAREREEGKKHPAPRDPIGKRPVTTPFQYPTGIFDTSDAPFPSSEFIISNRWQDMEGKDYLLVVYAGALADRPEQGVLIASKLSLDPSRTGDTQQILIPGSGGAVRITAVKGRRLDLVSTNGKAFVFDVSTKQITLK